MVILRDSEFGVIQILGGPQSRKKGRKYRLNKFIMTYQYDDETTLLLNVMTGSLVSLKSYEYSNIFTEYKCDYAEYLFQNYFIVPENFNENEAQDIIVSKSSKVITANYLDKPSTFTILTTSKCNARCKYCYELGVKNKHHMTKETAEKVARFIIDNHNDHEVIDLGWFGGEPLYNSEIIDIICSRINSTGLKYRSSMISNGYLMNERLLDKAKNLWKIFNVQITLDGIGDDYNKMKSYIYKDDPNPFETVMNNVKMLIENDIFVSIRMNCDNKTAPALKKLAKYLVKEFKDNEHKKNLNAYVHQIFEEEYTWDDEYVEELCKNMLEIQDILIKGRILIEDVRSSKSVHCLVDSGRGFTIMPDGELGLCEHYIDKRFIGHIDNPNDLDFDEIKKWRNYLDDPMCKDCVMRPACLKVIGCPDTIYCSEHWKNFRIQTNFMHMINMYEKFLENPIAEEAGYRPCDSYSEQTSCCNANQTGNCCKYQNKL